MTEKEKIDISSLFLLRLCVSLNKSNAIIIGEIIEKFNLQQELLVLLDFFLNNNEDHKPDYYFKLQNIVYISNIDYKSCIDINEASREDIINKFLTICKEIPLYRYKQKPLNYLIDRQLLESLDNSKVNEYLYFANNEEDVISSIIMIIRDIYTDSEGCYLSKLKDELIDQAINGLILTETEQGPTIPLIAKLEKTEKKIKKNKEEAKSYDEHIIKNKKIDIIVIEEKFDEKKKILEGKKNKYTIERNEKYYRGFLIISHVFKHAEFRDEISPEFFNITQNFIQRGLTKEIEDLYINWFALLSLGYSCLLSKEQTSSNLDKFFDCFASNYKILEATSILFIFDLLITKRITNEGKHLSCLKHLRISLNKWNMNDQHHLIKLILVEGFCKLLLRKVINTRTLVIAKLLEMYFYESTSSDIKTIIKAFLENYSKISEEMTIELAEAYIIYILDKYQSKNDSKVFEDKILQIIKLLDPTLEKTFEKTENLHFLIFYACFKYFGGNKKFFIKVINNLNLKTFQGTIGKFVKNRLNELQNAFKDMKKELDKCINSLPKFSEIVEDITYREYELRIQDIETQLENFNREKKDNFNYS